MVAMPKSESSTSCRRPNSMFSGLIDIAVDEFLLVRILQGVGYLLERSDDHRERDQAAFRIAMPQRAIGGIVHHQEGHAVLHIIIEDAHNRRMHEPGDGLRFLLKVLGLNAAQMGMHYLDSRLLVEPQVLPAVDLSIA